MSHKKEHRKHIYDTCDNLGYLDESVGIYNLAGLHRGSTEILHRVMMINKMNPVVKSFPSKQSPGPMALWFKCTHYYI